MDPVGVPPGPDLHKISVKKVLNGLQPQQNSCGKILNQTRNLNMKPGFGLPKAKIGFNKGTWICYIYSSGIKADLAGDWSQILLGSL